MEKIFADRTSKIDASGIRKVFVLASSLEEPVNFSIGQPDFDVPEALKEEAIKAIKAGQNKYSHGMLISQVEGTPDKLPETSNNFLDFVGFVP